MRSDPLLDPPSAGEPGVAPEEHPTLAEFLRRGADNDSTPPPPADDDGSAGPPPPPERVEAPERAAGRDDDASLPEGWGSAAPDLPPGGGPDGTPQPAPQNAKDPGGSMQPPPPVDSPPIPIADEQLALASTFRPESPWGPVVFAGQGAYQFTSARGPGFRVKMPTGWRRTERPHEALGGVQHRFIAPDELTQLVVAVFPLEEGADLGAFLRRKQVQLLSSFKVKSARNLILGRRSGLGVYYEGILLMRDVACHLFLTSHKGKGYMVYGLYFDRAGGERISQVMHSVRIY